jgi:hypothetical protein
MAAACLVCNVPFPPGSRSDRKTCCHSHAVTLSNRRKKARQEAAWDLLMRQTRAIQEGDSEALEAIAAEAEAFFNTDPAQLLPTA